MAGPRVAGWTLVLVAVVALAGCGLGPGEDRGSASLLVTRDYGRQSLLEKGDIGLTESSTAMRLLDAEADLETRYGGGFVQSVDGLAGGNENGRRSDWFYSVNGVMAERGSTDFPPGDGDLVWWDYRDWTDAIEVGAVVGAYPAPFTTGYDGLSWPVELDCLEPIPACDLARTRLEQDGVELAGPGAETSGTGHETSGSGNETIRLLVGTWARLAGTPEGKRLATGPDTSGVFARFENGNLIGLGVDGQAVRDFGPGAGLVAATRRGNRPPVWLLTGGDRSGVRLAAAALNREDLARRYAAVVFDGKVGSLPWSESGGGSSRSGSE